MKLPTGVAIVAASFSPIDACSMRPLQHHGVINVGDFVIYTFKILGDQTVLSTGEQ